MISPNLCVVLIMLLLLLLVMETVTVSASRARLHTWYFRTGKSVEAVYRFELAAGITPASSQVMRVTMYILASIICVTLVG